MVEINTMMQQYKEMLAERDAKIDDLRKDIVKEYDAKLSDLRKKMHDELDNQVRGFK